VPDEVLPPLALLPLAVSLVFAIFFCPGALCSGLDGADGMERDRPGAARGRVWADKTDGKPSVAARGKRRGDDVMSGCEVGGLARAVVPSRGEGLDWTDGGRDGSSRFPFEDRRAGGYLYSVAARGRTTR
jgi:hypothetical protein